MIKQLKMINKENLIVIEDSENNELFQINLDNMIFDSQKFYESFFKGLSEKIEYNLSNNIDENTSKDYKKNLRIYENINKLFLDIQKDVNALFDERDENKIQDQ
ncbi:MAG: hypothetical protein MR846_03540 [Tenericutes bacterium]|nr:hypothetical protein [Mycoplasmatota bacterium]MDD6941634.1 hypothetical protein [bacterium]MDY2697527.1 hypothetical protein [Bacilli bacterium]